jgi:hypothetical protein
VLLPTEQNSESAPSVPTRLSSPNPPRMTEGGGSSLDTSGGISTTVSHESSWPHVGSVFST